MRLKKKLFSILGVFFFGASLLTLTSCSNKNDLILQSFKLCDQLDTFISKLDSDGTLKEMQDIWFGNDESKKVIDDNLSGENGKIRFAGSFITEPVAYKVGDKYVGYSTDIVYRFAKEYGYSLEMLSLNNTADTITAITSGRADFGGSSISITEERRESGCFSIPYYENNVKVIINSSKKDEIKSVDDLNGMVFGCLGGSTYSQYIKEKMDRPLFLY